MTSLTTSPSISQGALLNFQRQFYQMAQQTKSKLVQTGAIMYLPAQGKTNEMARMGRLDLTEVNSRNPDKVYTDYAIDNRQFTKRRFTTTVLIDAKQDVNELIADPTSGIIQNLDNAKERAIDRVAIQAAVGTVLVGGPDTAPTSISAATDGVITIDGTAGMTYEIVQAVTQNFINSDLQYDQFQGAVINLTGKENAQLMGEIEFINTLYIDSKPVGKGVMDNTGTYRTQFYAGSVSGGAQALNPILPEGTTTRQCVVLAPGAIAMAMELASLDVVKSATKVNSNEITIDFWINAMRTEGVKTQIITTTM